MKIRSAECHFVECRGTLLPTKFNLGNKLWQQQLSKTFFVVTDALAQ